MYMDPDSWSSNPPPKPREFDFIGWPFTSRWMRDRYDRELANWKQNREAWAHYIAGRFRQQCLDIIASASLGVASKSAQSYVLKKLTTELGVSSPTATTLLKQAVKIVAKTLTSPVKATWKPDVQPQPTGGSGSGGSAGGTTGGSSGPLVGPTTESPVEEWPWWAQPPGTPTSLPGGMPGGGTNPTEGSPDTPDPTFITLTPGVALDITGVPPVFSGEGIPPAPAPFGGFGADGGFGTGFADPTVSPASSGGGIRFTDNPEPGHSVPVDELVRGSGRRGITVSAGGM